MDPRQFDSLARSFAAPKTRRGLLGSLAALGGGLLGVSEARAQATQASCGNKSCKNNPDKCNPGCVCCDHGNGNHRCRPPGTCVGTVICRSSQTTCGGACVDTGSDPAHCGGCGEECSPANATGVCASGQCGIDECAPDYGDCNGLAADGCETELAFDSNNCGACGNTCTGFDTCFGGGTPGQCGCTPDCTGKCGGASDGCGGTCTGDCGGGCRACVDMACVALAGAPCTLSGTPRAACNESGTCQQCGNATGSHSPQLTCAQLGPFCCSRLCVEDDPYTPGQIEAICAAYPGTACSGRKEPCGAGYTCVLGVCQ